MSWHHPAVLGIALGLAAGCAEHLHSLDQGVGWSTGVLFWPPPPATASWIPPGRFDGTFDDAAHWIDDSLRRGGYEDLRRWPIGAQWEHGFALATRLERVRDDGAPALIPWRWSPVYPHAPELRWLNEARAPYLPLAGRYRVFLVAITDLHVRPPGRPERWDGTTAMESPRFRPAEWPGQRRLPPDARIGVYIYEYKSADHEGEWLSEDTRISPKDQLARSGLSGWLEPRR